MCYRYSSSCREQGRRTRPPTIRALYVLERLRPGWGIPSTTLMVECALPWLESLTPIEWVPEYRFITVLGPTLGSGYQIGRRCDGGRWTRTRTSGDYPSSKGNRPVLDLTLTSSGCLHSRSRGPNLFPPPSDLVFAGGTAPGPSVRTVPVSPYRDRRVHSDLLQ